MKKKKSAFAYMVAMMFFFSGFGYLLYSGLTENSVYFLEVSEALAAPQETLQAARLFGTVSSAENIERSSALGVIFRMQDTAYPEKYILVNYKGSVPDTFKAGAEVIVEGSMATDGSFTASTLMTKCPSKYEKENRG